MQLKSLAFFLMAFAAGASAQTAVTTTTGGSAGSVPVFTSSNNVESSAITQEGGNVGIGTTTPYAPLHISGSVGNPVTSGNAGGQLFITNNGTYATVIGAYDGTSQYSWIQGQYRDSANVTRPLALQPVGGNVGIGTTSPQYSLDVAGQIRSSSGGVVFPDGTTQITAFIPANCGADFAEAVDVTGKRIGYQPGDVLVIDPDHAGKFLEANQAYSTMVAGIYSTKPGFVGRLYPAADKRSAGEVPMAMVGRVPTKVTTENGPIHVGDLLVSSSTPGYAMKGTDRSRMLGAVVGKALGSLDSGTGVIEVLVTLQ